LVPDDRKPSFELDRTLRILAHRLFRDHALKPAEIQANGGAVRGDVLGKFRIAGRLPAETVIFHGKDGRNPEKHPAVLPGPAVGQRDSFTGRSVMSLSQVRRHAFQYIYTNTW
jgi:hypothetical protein